MKDALEQLEADLTALGKRWSAYDYSAYDAERELKKQLDFLNVYQKPRQGLAIHYKIYLLIMKWLTLRAIAKLTQAHNRR